MTKIISVKNLNLYYGTTKALHNVSIDFKKNKVYALIGPSGCGKSSFLRCINRMNDLNEQVTIEGKINYNGRNIYSKSVDLVRLRKKIGMVFQTPTPFPKSIFENVAYGPRIHHMYKNEKELKSIVVESLQNAGLYDEVKDQLYKSALSLSGGQKQRLCIARAIAINPEVILMDEPCSALDPIATAKVERLIDQIRKNYTIIVVTHSMQQAARISDQTVFFDKGVIIESGKTKEMFTNPKNKQTQNYITGRYG